LSMCDVHVAENDLYHDLKVLCETSLTIHLF
jgi:hypothetical protein